MGWRLAVGISAMWAALAFLGDGLASLVLPVVLADTPDPATTVGLISFAGLGLAVALMPVAGRASDRLRDRVDRPAFMAVAAIPALVGLGILAASTGPWTAGAAFLIVLGAGSAIQAGLQTLIPEHVATPRRGRAASLKTAFDIGGAFVAFLLLGWALESFGVAGAAVACAAAIVVALVVVFSWVPAPVRGAAPPVVPASQPVPTGFWALVVSRFLFLLGIYVVGRFLLLLVAERLGVPAGSAAVETGGILATLTLMTAASAVVIGPLVDRLGRRTVMASGVVLGAAGTALFLPDEGLLGVLAGGALMSVGTAAFVTGNWAALTDLSPPEDAGRLMGLANIGTGGAAACAGLLGPAIDAWGFTPALVLATAAVVVALAPLARITPVPRMEGSPT